MDLIDFLKRPPAEPRSTLAFPVTRRCKALVTDGMIEGVGAFLIFLPQILILFFFISLLEETGYMARAAFLMDRLFSWAGLSGKSFVPLLSSFACAVPGILATRTIEDKKARVITIFIAPLMSLFCPFAGICVGHRIPHRTPLWTLRCGHHAICHSFFWASLSPCPRHLSCTRC